MHITFVGFGWEQLGLAQLSAIARQRGHTTGLAFSAGLFHDRYNLNIPFLSGLFNEDDLVLQEIARQHPDVLVFSPLTATYQWMLMIACHAKKLLPQAKTVFGGAHVSAVPGRVIGRHEVDYLCIGEGEAAFIQILESIQARTVKLIQNVWFKNSEGHVVRGGAAPFLQDLDGLPIMDKTLWEDVISFKDIYFTMASRGCPYQCTYCFNDYYSGLSSGKYVRFRSPEHVIRELKWAKDRYQLRLIEFEDDVFTLNKPWLKDLLSLYKKEINLPFQCLTHPKCMDDEVARILKEADCRYVQLGIQSLDDEYKQKVLKRPETTQDVERALESMAKYKINVKIDHMFALPGEPIQAQEKALQVYKRYPPYRMQTFWMNYFPQTTIMDHAQKLGILSPDDQDAIEEGKVENDYRDSAVLNDPEARHVYKAYECLFKLLTILPAPLRRKANVRGFLVLPNGVLSAIGFLVDLFSGLLRKNPDHWSYAKHYINHMIRIFSRKSKKFCHIIR